MHRNRQSWVYWDIEYPLSVYHLPGRTLHAERNAIIQRAQWRRCPPSNRSALQPRKIRRVSLFCAFLKRSNERTNHRRIRSRTFIRHNPSIWLGERWRHAIKVPKKIWLFLSSAVNRPTNPSEYSRRRRGPTSLRIHENERTKCFNFHVYCITL